MNKALLLFCFLLFNYSLKAQNILSDNAHVLLQGLSPAYTGERGLNGFGIVLGNQFNGTLRPNQISQIFNIDGKLGEGPSAIGFTGYRSSFGTFSLSGFTLSYSYKIINTDNFKVNAGANLGFLVLPNFINSDFFQRFSTYGGFGFLFNGNRWFGSISSPALFSSTTAKNFLGGTPINVHLGYLFQLNDNLVFAPSALVQTGVNRWQIGTRLWMFDNIILGTYFRQNTDGTLKILPTLEYNLNGSSKFGIAYDPLPQELANLPNIQNFNSGIFQIFYKYEVELKKQRELLNWF